MSTPPRGAIAMGWPAGSTREVGIGSIVRSKVSPGRTDGSRRKKKTASGPSAALTEPDGDSKFTCVIWLSARPESTAWATESPCAL